MGASLTTKRIRHFVLGLVFGLWASGCRESNPAYLGKSPPLDSAAQPDGSAPGAEVDGAPLSDTGLPSPDEATDEQADQGATANVDAEADGAAGGIEPDALPNLDEGSDESPAGADEGEIADLAPGDARNARDGRRGDETAARDLGVEPDHTVAPDEGSDAIDAAVPDAPVLLDGIADAGDAAEVGADSSSVCTELDTRQLVTPGNPLVGACHAGKQVCLGGTWVTSIAEVLPAPAEACNGIDDNCNGAVDEGCVDQCIVVAPAGSAGGDGSPQNPFATIEQAIAAAGSADGGSRTQVCVAAADSCSNSATFPSGAALKMRDGIEVQGNYALTANGLVYCGGVSPQPTTTIAFTAASQGVVFDQGIASRTELSGFVIDRFSGPSTGPTTGPSIAGVVVSGGKNVWLAGLFINDAVDGATTYGVSITNGGQATIVGSAIGGGLGRTSAVGVFVDGGAVDLRNNCDNLVGGVCKSSCSDAQASLGIRGRDVSAQANTGVESSAVFISSAGVSPSTMVGNMLCGGPSNLADSTTSAAGVAALRCASGGCGEVSGNAIAGGSGRASVGLALAGTGGPIDANRIEGGCGSRSAAGALLENALARLQNNLIFGGQCSSSGSQSSYYGLHVVSSGASAALAGEIDVDSNDIEPEGQSTDCQSVGVYVERLTGGPGSGGPPAGVLRNNIVSAGICNQRTGVDEVNGAGLRVFESNDLYAPQSTTAADTAVLYLRGSNDVTASVLSAASNNISADPRYRAYPADLHLDSDSPCIDKGSPVGAPSTDADGAARPQGHGFDIGAYEFKN